MQKIYYGAPGTGKSYEILKYLKEKQISDEHIFRVTFHPEYTYSDFVDKYYLQLRKMERYHMILQKEYSL